MAVSFDHAEHGEAEFSVRRSRFSVLCFRFAVVHAGWHPKSFVSLDQADHLLTKPSDAAYVADIIAAWVSRYLDLQAGWIEEIPEKDVVVEETGGGKYQVSVKTGHARLPRMNPEIWADLAQNQRRINYWQQAWERAQL